MVQDDIGPEPERYYEWMMWKLRQSKKWQEMKKYSKEKRIEEKHKHTNGLMLDLKELTKCHYDLLKKYQELYNEHEVLQCLFDIKQKKLIEYEMKQNQSRDHDALHGPEHRQRYNT